MKAELPGRGRSYSSLLESAFAALIGFLVAGAVLAILGYNPALVYYYMLDGAVGNLGNLATVLTYAAPLILTALTFAIGVRAGLFNIGSEGQLYVGAAAAIGVSFVLMPPGVHLLVTIAVAGLVGALYAIPVFLLKAFRGVNEVITTIMLNWISYYGILWVVRVLIFDPAAPYESIAIAPGARFPADFLGTGTFWAFVLSVLTALAVYFYLWLTPSGYDVRALGLNADAAKYGGISARKPLLYSILIGGATSGIAGAFLVNKSPSFALNADLSNVANYGYNGIGVSLIGRNHPLAILAAGLFFGALQAGTSTLQAYAKVPYSIVVVIEGIIIFTLAAPELYHRLRGRVRK